MVYDCIIIGSGPAGMTAAIYLKRAGKSVLVFEKSMVGGQMSVTHKIENYTGFKSIDGADLAIEMFSHAEDSGAEFVFEEVIDCNFNGKDKIVKTASAEYLAKSVIIATGAYARNLEVKGEEKFKSKGVSYCATCDGSLYKNKTVCVVGGGNSSFEDCLYLLNIAKKVYLVHRNENLRGDKQSLEKLKEYQKQGKLEFVLNTSVAEILGNDSVSKIKTINNITLKQEEIECDAVFVAIGRVPSTKLFADIIADKNGYFVVESDLKTNKCGVFVAGDVRQKILRQVITAASDGAVASVGVIAYLNTAYDKLV